MKSLAILALMAFAAADSVYYDLEDIDMNKLVENNDDLSEFIKCLLGKAPCNKLYESYRVVCAEAIEQKCKKCSPIQKHNFWLFLQGVTAKFPDDSVNFRNKYDPENKYFEALVAELRKYSKEY